MPKNIISLIDLTTFNEANTDERIIKFCKNSVTPFGRVASLFIAPKFISLAREHLNHQHGEKIKVGTVVNYPTSTLEYDEILKATAQALHDGAKEIELLLPKQSTIQMGKMIAGVHALCIAEDAELTVTLDAPDSPAEALFRAQLAIENGAKWLKNQATSPNYNDHLQDLSLLLEAVKGHQDKVGIKISAGSLDLEEARLYLAEIAKVFGEEWIIPAHLRFGTSSLLTQVLRELGAVPC